MFSMIYKHPIPVKTLLINARSICEVTLKYLRCGKNVSPVTLAVRSFLTKSARLSNGVQSTRLFKPSKLPQSLLVRHQQTIKLDLDTNVCNNVILYKIENKRYIQIMHLCGMTLLVGWSLLALYTYTPSFFDIFYTDITLSQYMKNNILRLLFFIAAIIIGPVSYATVYAFSSRTVRYIVLHKGGKKVTFTTCNLWKKNCNIQVPIDMITCVNQRTNTGSVMPLKIKDKRFYYLVDKKGTFLNPELFDHTIGYSRNL